MHNELAFRAQNEGVSLNQYIVYALTRQVSSSYTIQVLPEETVSHQKESFEKLLDSLGDASIQATKVFLEGRDFGEQEDGLTDEIIAHLKEKIETSAV